LSQFILSIDGYIGASVLGVVFGIFLLSRVRKEQRIRRANKQNGILGLIIIKAGIRYTIVSGILLSDSVLGFLALVDRTNPWIGFLLLIQPYLLLGCMSFEYISDRRILKQRARTGTGGQPK
jgi:putative Mn2+ efflux pump MntP